MSAQEFGIEVRDDEIIVTMLGTTFKGGLQSSHRVAADGELDGSRSEKIDLDAYLLPRPGGSNDRQKHLQLI